MNNKKRLIIIVISVIVALGLGIGGAYLAYTLTGQKDNGDQQTPAPAPKTPGDQALQDAMTAIQEGDKEAAREFLDRAVELYREAGDEEGAMDAEGQYPVIDDMPEIPEPSLVETD